MVVSDFFITFAPSNLNNKIMAKRNVIKMNINKVHTEHCYVQNVIVKIQDTDHAIWTQIKDILSALCVPSMYLNHFVLECVNTDNQTFYIGYNDNVVSIGLKIGKMSDSKTHQVSLNISHIAFYVSNIAF